MNKLRKNNLRAATRPYVRESLKSELKQIIYGSNNILGTINLIDEI
jgi:hypothetical protein